MMKLLVLLVLLPPLTAFAAPVSKVGASAVKEGNDYPTAARADYVFACMNVNGRTHVALDRCSCSIDVIASILPYHDYEEAETVLRMQQAGGYLANEFRVPDAKELVRKLREAQAEGDMRCF